MQGPEKNSYQEFGNEKKFLQVENFPPPHNFSNGPSLMDEEMVKRQHFSMVFDSLNDGTVYFIRNTFIVDKMKRPF